MFGFKRIDLYLVRQFISVFFATFFICLFVVVMQFLWQHVNDMVGKGLDFLLLLEFFLYSSLSMVPLALPLAILLASLMTFGNLGERLELLAMKSAGVSLFRIMAPLITLVAGLSIGAFFFSNNVMPITQKKLWTLIFSMRHKSPELEIPTGEFYSEINGLNIYVRQKDHKKKLLKNLMIYDFSNGFRNATVMTADSARIKATADKMNLILILYDGETFENLKQQMASSKENVPYRRESFKRKEILIDFDANFNRFDESLLQDQHVSKDVVRLKKDMDSALILKDSLIHNYCEKVKKEVYFRTIEQELVLDSTQLDKNQVYNHDTLFYSLSQPKMERAILKAINEAEININDIRYNKAIINDAQMFLTRHAVEWYRKFTLSFACMIFFFIGSPLGAIIRKGGLGMPVVISVVLFIVYYIIDNTGYKMAREGIWEVWQGMWFSSSILLPMGIFLTYKAAKDAALMNPEAWKNIFLKIKKGISNLLKYGTKYYRRSIN